MPHCVARCFPVSSVVACTIVSPSSGASDKAFLPGLVARSGASDQSLRISLVDHLWHNLRSTFHLEGAAKRSWQNCSKQSWRTIRSWSIEVEELLHTMKNYSIGLRWLRCCYTYSWTDNFVGLLNCINYYYCSDFKHKFVDYWDYQIIDRHSTNSNFLASWYCWADKTECRQVLLTAFEHTLAGSCSSPVDGCPDSCSLCYWNSFRLYFLLQKRMSEHSELESNSFFFLRFYFFAIFGLSRVIRFLIKAPWYFIYNC
jgi:hypothetical protein